VKEITTIYISKSLFNEQMKLIDIKQSEWQDDFVRIQKETKDQPSSSSIDVTDLPF